MEKQGWRNRSEKKGAKFRKESRMVKQEGEA